MIHKRTLLRPGMTAIAAVLALSSTQLLAQSADAPAAADAPVLVTPPPVVQSVAPQSVAPQSVVPATSDEAQQAAAPPTTMRTASTPIVNTPDSAATSEEASAPARTVTHTKTTQVHKATTEPKTAEAVPVAPAAPVAVAKSTVVKTTPIGTETATTTKSVSPPRAPQPAQTVSNDEIAAGIAGLGLIALAGGAFAYSRRKREAEYDEVETVPATVDVIPADPIVAPTGVIYAEEPRTEVPAGFDISRFGRHTQAAYRGPTPENPSLSLKNRLKRASFYDQRERMAAAGTAQAIEAPVERPVTATAPRRTEHADHIVSRMRPAKPNFRPITA